MMLANQNAIESGGYVIERSLRFSAASSNYLTRTPSGAGDRLKWTWKANVKRGMLDAGAPQYFLFSANAGASDANYFALYFSADRLYVTGQTTVYKITSKLFRDPNAHIELMIVWDTAQATAADRLKIYVNNEQLTSFTSDSPPTLNQTSGVNAAAVHSMGCNSASLGANDFDGYLSEVYFIDGQALTPSSFGETNIETGEWVAKPYTGTYGTNGFSLDFKDGTSTTTLGYDAAGSNDWTLTNFTRSAGVNDCWMEDVPAGNGEASAVQPSGNYAVLNSLNKNASVTVNRANLAFSNSNNRFITSSLAAKVGKYYAEFIPASSSSAGVGFGLIKESDNVFGTASFSSAASFTGVGYLTSGQKSVSGTLTAYGTAMAANDVIGIAIDLDASPQTITFYKNNTSQGSINLPTNTDGWVFASDCSEAGTHNVNFGQRSFAYTPPTGFKALCTSNLPTPPIPRGDNHFDAETYTGTGASNKRTLRFQPDFLWTKRRSAAENHWLVDVIRGVSKGLYSNLTNAEVTQATCVTSFDSDGYTLGTDVAGFTNVNGQTYVGWAWKGGGTPVSNTSGSITSQVSANTTAGFSVVKWSGNGSAGATIGHGLGKVPALILPKYTAGSPPTGNWHCYHKSLGGNQGILLNATNAASTDAGFWNNTSPSSTVITLGTYNVYNAVDYVAYCFAEIEGFSKAFTFTGNASADGTFVYLGFKPRWILLKCSSTTGNWYIFDTVRNTFNVLGEQLYPNLANAGSTVTTLDVVSNGFKLRLAGDPNAARTYIGFAIAQTPINYANAF